MLTAPETGANTILPRTIMKAKRPILITTGALAAFLLPVSSIATAQPAEPAETQAETSTTATTDEPAEDSTYVGKSTIAVPPPAPETPPVIATLQPMLEGSDLRGTLTFRNIANLVSITGRIEGLEPSRRYRLEITPSIESDRDTTPPQPPLSAGQPNAGAPKAGPPVAGAPVQGAPSAGTPRGQTNPASQSGNTAAAAAAPDEQGLESTGLEGADAIPFDEGQQPPMPTSTIVVVTADPQGSTNINTSMKEAPLDDSPRSIVGRTITLRIEAANGQQSHHIAAAVIKTASNTPATPGDVQAATADTDEEDTQEGAVPSDASSEAPEDAAEATDDVAPQD